MHICIYMNMHSSFSFFAGKSSKLLTSLLFFPFCFFPLYCFFFFFSFIVPYQLFSGESSQWLTPLLFPPILLFLFCVALIDLLSCVHFFFLSLQASPQNGSHHFLFPSILLPFLFPFPFSF